MQIRESTILITGASSGIGAAFAQAAARMGARVVLLARNAAALETVAETIRAAGGSAHVFPADLTDPAAVDAVVARILAEVGTPDVVVSNAGSGRWLFAEETPPAEAAAMVAMPYLAGFYLSRALLPALLKRGRGHIMYVNSPAALLAWPGATAYTAARWALRGLAEAMRADLYRTKIRVSTVIPGKVSSSYFANNPGSEARVPGLAKLLPTLTPEQAAERMLRAIARDEQFVVFPLGLKLLYYLHGWLPGLVRWLAVTTGARRPRSGGQ